MNFILSKIISRPKSAILSSSSSPPTPSSADSDGNSRMDNTEIKSIKKLSTSVRPISLPPSTQTSSSDANNCVQNKLLNNQHSHHQQQQQQQQQQQLVSNESIEKTTETNVIAIPDIINFETPIKENDNNEKDDNLNLNLNFKKDCVEDNDTNYLNLPSPTTTNYYGISSDDESYAECQTHNETVSTSKEIWNDVISTESSLAPSIATSTSLYYNGNNDDMQSVNSSLTYDFNLKDFNNEKNNEFIKNTETNSDNELEETIKTGDNIVDNEILNKSKTNKNNIKNEHQLNKETNKISTKNNDDDDKIKSHTNFESFNENKSENFTEMNKNDVEDGKQEHKTSEIEEINKTVENDKKEEKEIPLNMKLSNDSLENDLNSSILNNANFDEILGKLTSLKLSNQTIDNIEEETKENLSNKSISSKNNTSSSYSANSEAFNLTINSAEQHKNKDDNSQQIATHRNDEISFVNDGDDDKIKSQLHKNFEYFQENKSENFTETYKNQADVTEIEQINKTVENDKKEEKEIPLNMTSNDSLKNGLNSSISNNENQTDVIEIEQINKTVENDKQEEKEIPLNMTSNDSLENGLNSSISNNEKLENLNLKISNQTIDNIEEETKENVSDKSISSKNNTSSYSANSKAFNSTINSVEQHKNNYDNSQQIATHRNDEISFINDDDVEKLFNNDNNDGIIPIDEMIFSNEFIKTPEASTKFHASSSKSKLSSRKSSDQIKKNEIINEIKVTTPSSAISKNLLSLFKEQEEKNSLNTSVEPMDVDISFTSLQILQQQQQIQQQEISSTQFEIGNQLKNTEIKEFPRINPCIGFPIMGNSNNMDLEFEFNKPSSSSSLFPSSTNQNRTFNNINDDENFQSGLIFSEGDFDFLLSKEDCNKTLPPNKRDSILLRFDPLLGHSEPWNQQQQQQQTQQQQQQKEIENFLILPSSPFKGIKLNSTIIEENDNDDSVTDLQEQSSNSINKEKNIENQNDSIVSVLINNHHRNDSNSNSSNSSSTINNNNNINCSNISSDSNNNSNSNLLLYPDNNNIPENISTSLQQQTRPIKNNQILNSISQDKKGDDKMSVDVIHDIKIEKNNSDVNKSIDNLNKHTSEEKQDYKMEDLEKKIKNEVLKTEDIEKKLKDAEQREEALIKRITEKDKAISKMSGVIEEYEKALAELIAEKEQIKQNYDKQIAELQADSNLNCQHLLSLEITFADLHVKYERSKQNAEKLQKCNEDLLEEKKKMVENLRLQEERYEKMKSHAFHQLETAGNKFELINKNHSGEITKLKALLKKEEISQLSITEQLQQKIRENEELMKICDELINSQGS